MTTVNPYEFKFVEHCLSGCLPGIICIFGPQRSGKSYMLAAAYDILRQNGENPSPIISREQRISLEVIQERLAPYASTLFDDCTCGEFRYLINTWPFRACVTIVIAFRADQEISELVIPKSPGLPLHIINLSSRIKKWNRE